MREACSEHISPTDSQNEYLEMEMPNYGFQKAVRLPTLADNTAWHVRCMNFLLLNSFSN